MFYLHEKVVYPGHGIAEVNRVVEKNIGGESKKLLELKFLHKDMVVLVPLSNVDEIGLRKLSRKSDIENIYIKKELSFGERALLQQAETLLAQEISMVQDIFEDNAKNQLRSFFGSPIVKISKHSEKTI